MLGRNKRWTNPAVSAAQKAASKAVSNLVNNPLLTPEQVAKALNNTQNVTGVQAPRHRRGGRFFDPSTLQQGLTQLDIAAGAPTKVVCSGHGPSARRMVVLEKDSNESCPRP